MPASTVRQETTDFGRSAQTTSCPAARRAATTKDTPSSAGLSVRWPPPASRPSRPGRCPSRPRPGRPRGARPCGPSARGPSPPRRRWRSGGPAPPRRRGPRPRRCAAGRGSRRPCRRTPSTPRRATSAASTATTRGRSASTSGGRAPPLRRCPGGSARNPAPRRPVRRCFEGRAAHRTARVERRPRAPHAGKVQGKFERLSTYGLMSEDPRPMKTQLDLLRGDPRGHRPPVRDAPTELESSRVDVVSGRCSDGLPGEVSTDGASARVETVDDARSRVEDARAAQAATRATRRSTGRARRGRGADAGWFRGFRAALAPRSERRSLVRTRADARGRSRSGASHARRRRTGP